MKTPVWVATSMPKVEDIDPGTILFVGVEGLYPCRKVFTGCAKVGDRVAVRLRPDSPTVVTGIVQARATLIDGETDPALRPIVGVVR